jgi:sensor domain CHASE-containing protein
MPTLALARGTTSPGLVVVVVVVDMVIMSIGMSSPGGCHGALLRLRGLRMTQYTTALIGSVIIIVTLTTCRKSFRQNESARRMMRAKQNFGKII